MIYELQKRDYGKIKGLLYADIEKHPIINGVIDGINLGEIYVDNLDTPTSALIWAVNEMFYLIGNSKNKVFNFQVENKIRNTITPKAMALGEDHFNLELYPIREWETSMKELFSLKLNKGERVPFNFQVEKFCNLKAPIIANGYEIRKITAEIINLDHNKIIKGEIEKFWESTEKFLKLGMGYCALYGSDVIGSCISVYVSNHEYEIGINTYHLEHRGKGLASSMAYAFIQDCLSSDGNPHWTTEDFRKDSIAIAKKMGFDQLPNYPVYYLPFNEF